MEELKVLYMKVKKEADNFIIDKKNNFLVGNELYTIKEFEKIRYNFLKMGGSTIQLKGKFELVEIPKNKTHFFFGARFEDK